MATSEHVIMQNEALVALALIAALELGEYPSSPLYLFALRLMPKRTHRGRVVRVSFQCRAASSFHLPSAARKYTAVHADIGNTENWALLLSVCSIILVGDLERLSELSDCG